MVNLRDSLRTAMTIAAAAAALTHPATQAADSQYEMISYKEHSSSRALVEGAYATAIDLVLSKGRPRGMEDRLATATNLCVAYTLKRDFAAAGSTCETALDLAERIDENVSIGTFRSKAATGVAMTNRGVLRALSGDMSGAVRDFRDAVAMKSTPGASARNLANLEAWQVAMAEPAR